MDSEAQYNTNYTDVKMESAIIKYSVSKKRKS